jgi:hypothetical protein
MWGWLKCTPSRPVPYRTRVCPRCHRDCGLTLQAMRNHLSVALVAMARLLFSTGVATLDTARAQPNSDWPALDAVFKSGHSDRRGSYDYGSSRTTYRIGKA